MYAIPEPLRSRSIEDVEKIRMALPDDYQPSHYQEWIDYAFGETFADNFPKVYTQKYWTTDPANLTTDWIGKRVYFPEISDMVESAKGPLQKETHYISSVRYPQQGGFYSYIKSVEAAININYNQKLKYISFERKELTFDDGETTGYEKLINTLPIPMLILNSDAPDHIKNSARKLKCSQVLIVNVIVNHPPVIDNHWIYVYDGDFYSTRINFTDLLAPNNGVAGKCGIQVEVYFSDYHPLNGSIENIAKVVVFKELIEMKLIKSEDDIESYHHKWIDWANVIFDKERLAAQNEVLNWLETKGLVREEDDLEPMTDWDTKEQKQLGDLIMAGRFAQWKYYWTDDCVMRGKYIADSI
jgi:protoporphyrinogen oxidase